MLNTFSIQDCGSDFAKHGAPSAGVVIHGTGGVLWVCLNTGVYPQVQPLNGENDN